jgi:processive 1,2-diacylglycerol beta-glucosyltransferase
MAACWLSIHAPTHPVLDNTKAACALPGHPQTDPTLRWQPLSNAEEDRDRGGARRRSAPPGLAMKASARRPQPTMTAFGRPRVVAQRMPGRIPGARTSRKRRNGKCFGETQWLPCGPAKPASILGRDQLLALAGGQMAAEGPTGGAMPDPALHRILILHAKAGAGHKRAAESLEKAFRTVDPETRVHALDTMAFASRLFQRTYAQTYDTMVQRIPRFWGWLYWGLERRGVHKGTAPARMQVDRLNLRRLVKAVRRFKPAALVCTHFLPMSALSVLARKGELGAPLYCVVTDFGAHPFWVFKGVTRYFVASPEGREDLAEWGVPWESVSVSGIPVDPRFSRRAPQREARLALDLDASRPMALVMGGGNGVGPLYEMAEGILRLPSQPQVAVIAGHNEKMLERLRELEVRHPGRMRAIGYTNEVDRWLDAADVNVTKAGGLTCSESLAKEVPMVIFRPTPGQEDRNSQALTTVGAALRARTLPQVSEAVDRILADDELRESMHRACRFLGKPDAGAAIARRILEETTGYREEPGAGEARTVGPQAEPSVAR